MKDERENGREREREICTCTLQNDGNNLKTFRITFIQTDISASRKQI